MDLGGEGLIIIGENVNATRKIRITSPRVVSDGGKVGIGYTDLDGSPRLLDVTAALPPDEGKRRSFAIPHIAIACRQQDLAYLRWSIRNQELHGAHIIDLCVDEMSEYPEERRKWIGWLVRVAQQVTSAVLAIDSSDPETIRAGLDAHDRRLGRVAINSFNLEPGRHGLLAMARERDAMLFANASGESTMPSNADDRVKNLVRCMDLMDAEGIAMRDRFLDPLVFPIGAGPDSGNHYLDAVRQLRALYPEVHLFGGHSNVSFGLPERKLLNETMVCLAVAAGCDTAMIDPVMNPPRPLNDFYFASRLLTGRDEYSVGYIEYTRRRAQGANP